MTASFTLVKAHLLVRIYINKVLSASKVKKVEFTKQFYVVIHCILTKHLLFLAKVVGSNTYKKTLVDLKPVQYQYH